MAEKVHLSKRNEVAYEKLTKQPYLTSRKFNNKERNLLYAIRSRCHASKANFRKMYKNDLQCTFGCQETEDQRHTFSNCTKIRQRQMDYKIVTYKNIFGRIVDQKEVISEFIKLEYTRLTLREELLPGGIDDARTQADPSGTAVVDSYNKNKSDSISLIVQWTKIENKVIAILIKSKVTLPCWSMAWKRQLRGGTLFSFTADG